MRSYTANSFTDGELHAELPASTQVYDVDAPGSGIPGGLARVDWAWDEPMRHFLCELKDPECAGAVKYDPGAAARMQAELAGPAFPGELAQKAHHTTRHHLPSATATNVRVFIIMAAISALTAAEMGAAGLVVEREMTRLGSPMTAIVVNIAEWNAQLAPRSIERV